MDDEAFDWDDDATIVIRSVKAVAVYRNKYNEVVIRQEHFSADEEDHFIHVPSSELRRLIDVLQKQLDLN